jgi:hypothetical protein
MEKNEARQHPLIQRFNTVSSEDDRGTKVICLSEFLSLMIREYMILSEQVKELRLNHIKDKTAKNVDRIDGLTKAFNLISERGFIVQDLFRVLYPSARDPLLDSTRCTASKLFECSCGDFMSTEFEVDSHIAVMLMLEDVKTHTKLIPVDKIEDVN